MNLLGLYADGDTAAYAEACDEMRERVLALPGPVLVAHHGDCDGITGGAILAHVLKGRGLEVRFASSAEFRDPDLAMYEAESVGCEAAVFVEAQGMTPGYARLDGLFLNIDHHPHPPDTPVRRMLNPRRFGIAPNPAIGFVMYELFADLVPPGAAWLAALASILDYCPAPACRLIESSSAELARLDDLRDTFLSCQYVAPMTTRLADLCSRFPPPDELIAAEPFAARRERYRALLDAAIRSARVGTRLVLAEAAPGEIRVSSPLANRLQDLHPSKCVVVVEDSENTSRVSVRCRTGAFRVGETLARIAGELGAGDGTGHERAGSARIPRALKERFLRKLEDEVG